MRELFNKDALNAFIRLDAAIHMDVFNSGIVRIVVTPTLDDESS